MSSWSTNNSTQTADGTISTPVWTVSHTQGTVTYAQGNQSYVVGQGTFDNNNFVFLSNSPYDYTLQRYVLRPYVIANGATLTGASADPYLANLSFPALTSNLRVYTNITDSDFPNYYTQIQTFTNQTYMFAINGTNVGNRQYINTYKESWIVDPSFFNVVPAGGTSNNPVQIGDTGTHYFGDHFVWDPNTSISPTNIQYQIGTATSTTAPGVFSDFYYTFNIYLLDTLPTKTYQFRFELDWNYL
jgi:hypothetical protein